MFSLYRFYAHFFFRLVRDGVPFFVPLLGEETSQFCVKLAVNQAQSSSSLASFLSSLLNPVVFMGLEVRLSYAVMINGATLPAHIFYLPNKNKTEQ